MCPNQLLFALCVLVVVLIPFAYFRLLPDLPVIILQEPGAVPGLWDKTVVVYPDRKQRNKYHMAMFHEGLDFVDNNLYYSRGKAEQFVRGCERAGMVRLDSCVYAEKYGA